MVCYYANFRIKFSNRIGLILIRFYINYLKFDTGTLFLHFQENINDSNRPH